MVDGVDSKVGNLFDFSQRLQIGASEKDCTAKPRQAALEPHDGLAAAFDELVIECLDDEICASTQAGLECHLVKGRDLIGLGDPTDRREGSLLEGADDGNVGLQETC